MVRVGAPFPKDPAPAVAFHLGDHLGSSNVVLGSNGEWINREEYTPYGETSFGSFALKRYRFTGKERDEESGLYYHGARYYAPWVARWMSCDPLIVLDNLNLFGYASCNPIQHIDPSGMQDTNNIGHFSPEGEQWASPESQTSHDPAEGGLSQIESPPNVLSDWPPPRASRTPAPFGLSDHYSVAPDPPHCRSSNCHQPGRLTAGYSNWLEPQDYVGHTVAGLLLPIFGNGEASAPRSAEESAAAPKSLSEEDKILESAKFFALWYAPKLFRTSRSGVSGSSQSGGVEVYYRTMQATELEHLELTGMLPRPLRGETGISPTQFYSEARYSGSLVEFRLRDGTTDELAAIGFRDTSRLTSRSWSELPRVMEGWGERGTFFKGEINQVNILLGYGEGIQIFNHNLKGFRVLRQ